MIAIVDLSEEPNGANLVTKWFLREIEGAGIPVTFFDSLPRRKKSYRTNRIFLGLRAVIFLIEQRLQREKNLYLPLAGGSYLTFQFLHIVIAKLLGYRIYLHHHSYSYITKQSALLRKILGSNSANQIHIFLTNKMRNDFENVYGYVRASTILTNALVVEGFNKHRWSTDEYASKEKVKLVHYGRLSTAKGSDVVLELYSKLLYAGLSVSCLVAGPVKDSDIREKIFELKRDFPHSFTHIEEYIHTELHQILFDCDFFLFPSKYENEAAPLVVYEAQFNGLVCYTSQAGSLQSIVAAPGVTVEMEDWLSTIMKIIETESISGIYKSPVNSFLKKKQVRSAMETEALDGKILLEGLISLMREHEPHAIVE